MVAECMVVRVMHGSMVVKVVHGSRGSESSGGSGLGSRGI